jgi:hypothetical protein
VSREVFLIFLLAFIANGEIAACMGRSRFIGWYYTFVLFSAGVLLYGIYVIMTS